ncbi:MAG TPA: hypothetical protein VE570_06200 [Thermoleophilaceae bacterium]|jgi:hypothetical protein|nr:hypothetical protein [Thermoleophilaceae bacterium]
MHKTRLRPRPLSKLRRLSHERRAEQHVHFHRGPQGQPMPCYESSCPSPRLSI